MTIRSMKVLRWTLAAFLLAASAGPVLAAAALASRLAGSPLPEALPTPPAILDVVIDRGRDTDWWDWTRYHQRFTIQLAGAADDQPVYLLVQDMQGSRYVIAADGSSWYDPQGTNAGGSSDVRITLGPDYTYTYTWYEARKPLPIPAGSYEITVIGTATTWPTLTTPAIPAVPEEGPVLSAPAADGVIETTPPTLEWTGPGGSETWLQVRAEGALNYSGPTPDEDDAGEIWRADVTGQSSAVYNFDVSGPDLEPGRAYFWQVNAWSPVDLRVSDPRVEVWTEQTARHRFTIDTDWPLLPILPGKLAYEHTMYGGWLPYNLQAILQYGQTVSDRVWVGPDASHTPCYSWDGSELAYRISDTGIFLDSQDGSPPTQVPNVIGWERASLSPDATQVTYADSAMSGTPPLNVYTHNVDGSGRRLLVEARGGDVTSPAWSPDGKWIAYSSEDDPSGHEIWLIRPDGTQDHPLLATSVAGYSGATVTYLGGAPVWSPDARRLGVSFAFTPSEGDPVTGIATVSREGGEIVPVWIDPPGVVCCAASGFGTWSPDGSSIVFNSAHHLSPDPDWGSGKFEPGVELWLIAADGSGSPTRLTYDYSRSSDPAWWAPNTPAASGVSVTKGDAAIAFATVLEAGSTSVFITPDPPAPAPEGYTLLGDCWKVLTDALPSGDITVDLSYRGAGVPAGAGPAVRLLAWESGYWGDETTALDTAAEVVRGRSEGLSHFTLALVQRFADVDFDLWAFGAINACVNAGIVAGYDDGTYHPDWPVTRDQMAVYISRALAGGDDEVPAFSGTPTFPDVPEGNWALRYVEYAVGQQVVSGYDDGTYHPEYEVTRDQMAVYVARALVAPTGEPALAGYVPSDPRNFPDVASEFWAYKHIEYCVEHGVVNGYDDGLYHPDWVVTRDQMAVYVARAFELPV